MLSMKYRITEASWQGIGTFVARNLLINVIVTSKTKPVIATCKDSLPRKFKNLEVTFSSTRRQMNAYFMTKLFPP